MHFVIDSLGGNSRTIMVANIGPASYNYEETVTTLRYASRAKKIRNKPQINEDPKDALLRSFQEEIGRLRTSLENKRMRSSKKRGDTNDIGQSIDKEWKDKEAQLERQKRDILNNANLLAEEKDKLLQVTTFSFKKINA